jgi:hypothetical protein
MLRGLKCRSPHGGQDTNTTPPPIHRFTAMIEQRQHFRFLDLPREVRDEIYDHALCAFSRRQSPYSVEQYAKVYAGAEFEERSFLGTIDLLLANKQIYEEGHDSMLKKNLFVRIECCGFQNGVENYVHGRTPELAVLACNKSPQSSNTTPINKYSWCAMHIQIDGVLPPYGQQEYRDIVMLWEDYRDFFARFEAEARMWHLSVLKLDPMKMVVKVESSSPERNVGGDFSVWSEDGMQKKLLQPIEEGLRGYHDLEIVGCLNEEIAMKTSQTVQSLSGPIHTLSRHIWHLS